MQGPACRIMSQSAHRNDLSHTNDLCDSRKELFRPEKEDAAVWPVSVRSHRSFYTAFNRLCSNMSYPNYHLDCIFSRNQWYIFITIFSISLDAPLSPRV